MNQGGGGDWGGIRYSDYDLLCIAESSSTKEGFASIFRSNSIPRMEIFGRTDTDLSLRVAICIRDLDWTFQSTRPIIHLPLRCGLNVVFMHLKSGNEHRANIELMVASYALQRLGLDEQPTLFIGDFNRASSLPDQSTILYEGGGQANWWLDRVIGINLNRRVDVEEVSRSSDHAHAGLAITIH